MIAGDYLGKGWGKKKKIRKKKEVKRGRTWYISWCRGIVVVRTINDGVKRKVRESARGGNLEKPPGNW